MKKAYVKPVMQSEEFVTNAYCGACTDNPMPDTSTIIVNPSGPWYNPRRGTTISQSSLEKQFTLGHTFNANERADMISQANGYEGDAQWYWPCDCHDGQYYLEYSAEWADKFGNNFGVLFKERTNTSRPDGLQINWMCNSWPDSNYGRKDQAIALVQMSNATILNS